MSYLSQYASTRLGSYIVSMHAHSILKSSHRAKELICRRQSIRFRSSLKSLRDISLDQDGESNWAKSKNFWPQSSIQGGVSEPENNEKSTREHSDLEEFPRGKLKHSEFLINDGIIRSSGSTPTTPRTQNQCGKVALSRINVRKWEQRQRNIEKGTESQFRSNNGLRRILAKYMEQIEPMFRANSGNDLSIAEISLDDELLQQCFSHVNVDTLVTHGYDIEDVVSWSWILTPTDANRAASRYLALSSEFRESGDRQLPFFVTLQLLRAEQFDFKTWSDLIQEFKALVCLTTTDSASLTGRRVWDGNSATILIVRLLRHARLTNPQTIKDVVEIASALVKNKHVTNLGGKQETNHETRLKVSHTQRLALIYNRILSLLALPTPLAPFQSVLLQQQAQMDLMRQMLSFNPPVPVTREGYRALVRVQIAHEKTEEERAWASAKAHSWPPWREDKLGIQENFEYPGSDSRAMKVLHRMAEAGYKRTSWEKSAAVLAGWDTDQSPTIQSRRILVRKPMAWLVDKFQDMKVKPTAQPAEHDLWAARVTATRTIREAWSCFCSYKQATQGQDRKLGPYHAMFQKLFAKIQHSSEELGYTPGDGREIFPEPKSPRDQIYVKDEPPTVQQLYEEMIRDGVRPGGRLLAELLHNIEDNQDLAVGLQYVADSTYGDVKRDVLLHAENYPQKFIQDTLDAIPNYFLSAYIGMLGRSSPNSSVDLLAPGSGADGDLYIPPQSRKRSPMAYAFGLLKLSESKYLPAYTALLRALPTQWDTVRKHAILGRGASHGASYKLEQLSRYFFGLMEMIEQRRIKLDFESFPQTLKFIRKVLVHSRKSGFKTHQLKFVKKNFLSTAYGYRVTEWLPKDISKLQMVPNPASLFALVHILGLSQDITGLMALIRWLNLHAEELKLVQNASRSGETGMHRTMCAIRIVLEGSWTDEHLRDFIKIGTPKELAEAKGCCSPFGWPTDEDIQRFLFRNIAWRKEIRRFVQSEV